MKMKYAANVNRNCNLLSNNGALRLQQILTLPKVEKAVTHPTKILTFPL